MKIDAFNTRTMYILLITPALKADHPLISESNIATEVSHWQITDFRASIIKICPICLLF